MSDIHRPPSSEDEDGEIKDELEGKTYAPKSPVLPYAPKSPILFPGSPKLPSPKMHGRHEKKEAVSGSDHSDTELKRKKHHKSHKERKHHKHHDKDMENENEKNSPITTSFDQETLLRNKLLQNQRNRGSKERTDKTERIDKEKDRDEKERRKYDESYHKERERIREEQGERRVKKHNESGDEEEHFAIQPKDQLKSKPPRDDRYDKERSGRDRDRDQRDKKGRDDHRSRGATDRHRGDRPDRESKSKQRYDDRDRDDKVKRSSDVRDRDRKKDKDREYRDRREKDERKVAVKRSRTRSISIERVMVKRDRKSETRSPSKEGNKYAGRGEPHSSDSTPTPMNHSQMESMVLMDQYDEVETEASKSRRPGYSKFDSESEPEPEHESDQESHVRSPDRSPTPLRHADYAEEEPFDPSLVPFDELTDEQRSMIPDEELIELEKRWQKKLVDALPVYYAGVKGCRNVIEYHCINRIEEGTFGVVYRAIDKRTEEIVALKSLKMDKEKDGFPITSLREINMLLKAGDHENIVKVKEIVIGSNMDKIFLVMEFVEHDMKSLMDIMHSKGKKFTMGEVKTLVRQLLSGIEYMHDLWILHRDLKTSNLLLNHRGILKIADFGLAREYGEPLSRYTPVVVTLWYRSPELLLGAKQYSTPIDMWSVGCIMAEFIRLKPLFPGKGELDQINKIFHELGLPRSDHWPELDEPKDYPIWKSAKFDPNHFNQIRKHFPASLLDETGFVLLNMLLTYNPKKRIDASQALMHPWFKEAPLPTPPDMFPTFPAKSEQGKPPPPNESAYPNKQHSRIAQKLDATTAELYSQFQVAPSKSAGSFSLKFDGSRF